MLPEFFEFQIPTRIIYGNNILKDLPQELAVFGPRKAFIVTDKIIKKTGLLDKVLEPLKGSEINVVGVFDNVEPNTDVATVNEGARLAQEAGADMIITIGGGSPIDTAKGINILLSEGGAILDYQGAQLINRPLKPLIVVPTTAGTGSEVTAVAVIANLKEKIKMEFVDKFLRPDVAVLDPQMTVSMPAKLTASTGMDALTHAIEAYIDLENSPASDAMAIEAIKMIVRYIETATKNPEDIEARGGMLIGATLAGVAFSHSMVGVVHGMSHSLGGLCGVPHGIANAILLPHGMQYNLDFATERLADVAKALGVNTAGLDDAAAAQLGIDRIHELNQSLNKICGLPTKVSETGVKKEDLPKIAAMTLEDGTVIYNPRPIEEEEVLEVLYKAY